MREPVHEFFELNYLSESKRESQKNRKYLFECIINTVKITVKIGHGTRGLVRLIMTGYIVAGKNIGGYKYGGIAEKLPNLTRHN